MTHFPALRTARLTLRPFTRSDAEDLFAIRGDAEAMTFWDWPHDKDIAQTRRMAETIIQDIQASKACYWTATDADGRFCGIFDLSDVNGEADLGFMVPRPLWGEGLGFEGASALVNEAWGRGILTLNARIHEGNDRSARLLAKLGFVAAAAPEWLDVRPNAIIECRRFRFVRPQETAKQ